MRQIFRVERYPVLLSRPRADKNAILRALFRAENKIEI